MQGGSGGAGGAGGMVPTPGTVSRVSQSAASAPGEVTTTITLDVGTSGAVDDGVGSVEFEVDALVSILTSGESRVHKVKVDL